MVFDEKCNFLIFYMVHRVTKMKATLLGEDNFTVEIAEESSSIKPVQTCWFPLMGIV